MNVRVAVAVLLLLPSAAFAQGNPGPFGGLFGRTPERTGRQFTALEFRTSVGGQYDDAVFLDDELPPEDVPKSGFTSGGNLGLAFQRQSDRLTLTASGGATYQEFYQSRTFGATTYNATTAMRASLATRFDVEAQARYLRSPFFRLMPSFHSAAPAVVIPGDNGIVRLLENHNYDVGIGFTSRYAKHSTLSAVVSHRETKFSEGGKFTVLSAEGRWRRQLGRSLALNAGYGRERILNGAFQDTGIVHELVNLGVDFSKQLSLSQRTSLAFTTQTSIVKRPITGRRYRLNGSVAFAKLFGKTGNATLSLARTTEFLPGFIEPMLSDAVAGSISGLLSRRTEWFSNISVGQGQFGFEHPGKFVNGQATSRLNYALTSKFGVFAQYAVYYYKLPQTPTSIVILNSQVSRQSFTVGFNTWIPIINNVRTPRDPE